MFVGFESPSFEETNMSNPVPVYTEHPGTMRIAGRTLPGNAGRCAFFHLQRGLLPIDFLCVGGNANQQATKSMGVFCFMVKNAPEFANRKIQVAFQPLMFRMLLPRTADSKPEEKTVTVWRTMLVEEVKP